MPVYVEISPLHRLVTIVARGTFTADEVRSTVKKLADARVRRFAKIVEIAGAHLDFAPADIPQLAQTLRGDPDNRGPVAFIVAADSASFAREFAAATAHEGPVDIFHSLHQARAWIARIQQLGPQAVVDRHAMQAVTIGPDPDRQGTMIRGGSVNSQHECWSARPQSAP
jgi:hypothetical protein